MRENQETTSFENISSRYDAPEYDELSQEVKQVYGQKTQVLERNCTTIGDLV